MKKTYKAEGDYGAIGRQLNKAIKLDLEDSRELKMHMLMLIEHSLGALGILRSGEFSVVLSVNTDTGKISFTATPQG